MESYASSIYCIRDNYSNYNHRGKNMKPQKIILEKIDCDRTHLHTNISKYDYQKLIEYGKGQLNVGITNLIALADKKTIEINILTTIHLHGES